MARTTDPRAAAFDAAAFRDGIKFAMRMGAPEDPAQRVTFRWNTEQTFTNPDPAGRTYDWTAAPVTTTAVSDLQLDCAYEIQTGGNADNPVGAFDTAKLKVTLLDVDHTALLAHSSGRLPEVVLVGGNTYDVRYVTPVGLFDVTVFELHAEARDES